MQKELDTHNTNKSSTRNTAEYPSKKAKVKKVFARILVASGVLLLLFGAAVGLLHLKSVQTYIIGQVTDQLEKTLQVDVEIAQFHYRPLSHLSVDNIFLSDQQYDTLAFIEQMHVEFKPLQLFHNRIDIQRLQLLNPYVNLQSTSDSTLNIQFLLDVSTGREISSNPL